MDIESLYNRVWIKTIKLNISSVPFIWKGIFKEKWFITVYVHDRILRRYGDELDQYRIDDMHGVCGDTLKEAFERYEEFLKVLKETRDRFTEESGNSEDDKSREWYS